MQCANAQYLSAFAGIACDGGLLERWSVAFGNVWLLLFYFAFALYYCVYIKQIARQAVGWLIPLSTGITSSVKFLLCIIRFQVPLRLVSRKARTQDLHLQAISRGRET